MITRRQAEMARVTTAEVFTPNGDAGLLITVHRDDTASVEVDNSTVRYAFADLYPSSDLAQFTNEGRHGI